MFQVWLQEFLVFATVPIVNQQCLVISLPANHGICACKFQYATTAMLYDLW